MERTCVIVKPDGVGKKHVGDIIKRFEAEGLKLAALRMARPDRATLEDFYSMHKGKFFFEPFINFLSSGPIVISVWEGINAITSVRAIIGDTDSKKAKSGTLRNLYGTDNRRNLVHASDSPESAKREVNFFFKESEVIDYSPDAWETK